MGKLEYLDALKRAMTGLEPAIQAKTLAFYEQRFVDGVAIGRTEEEVAKELDDPKKIAMTLRANTHLKAFETKKNPANFVRMAFAAVGLAIFNLFMVVPAMVYAALLASLYATGLAFYLGGTVITGSGLSGNNEIKLDGPLGNIFSSDDDHDPRGELQTKVNIGEEGIRIFTERAPDAQHSPAPGVSATIPPVDANENTSRSAAREAARVARDAARTAAKAGAVAATAGATAAAEASAAMAAAGAAAAEAGAAAAEAGAAAAEAEVAAMDAVASAAKADEADSKRSVRVIKRAESVASHGILLSTGADGDSRATQIVIGLAMVLGGIILLLLSLVITRYTFIGLKRYIDMNVALLKGN